jgi:hypothetical protein
LPVKNPREYYHRVTKPKMLANVANGMCYKHGKEPRYLGSKMCRVCYLKRQMLERKRLGFKPWKPGGPGKRPFNYEH